MNPSRDFNHMNDAQLSFFEGLNEAIFAQDEELRNTPPRWHVPGWQETVEQAGVDASAIAEVRADQ